MSQNERNLHFGFSYNELINLSFEKEAFLTRDQLELLARGITTERLSNFAILRTNFIAIPTNETMVANISLAKQLRDQLTEPLRISIREIQGIAANTFGIGSAQHKAFTPQTLSNLDAGALYHLAATIVAQGNLYLTQMQAKGLTPAMLASISTQANALKPKITDFELVESSQLSTTQNRYAAANALYNDMFDMCQTAITYYQDRNALKAEEYVIYDAANSGQQRNGSILPNAIINRSFDGVNANSLFKLKAFEGNDLVAYFSNEKDGKPSDKKISIISNAKEFISVTAADLGYNDAKGFIFFCIKNEGAKETGYRIVMEE